MSNQRSGRFPASRGAARAKPIREGPRSNSAAGGRVRHPRTRRDFHVETQSPWGPRDGDGFGGDLRLFEQQRQRQQHPQQRLDELGFRDGHVDRLHAGVQRRGHALLAPRRTRGHSRRHQSHRRRRTRRHGHQNVLLQSGADARPRGPPERAANRRVFHRFAGRRRRWHRGVSARRRRDRRRRRDLHVPPGHDRRSTRLCSSRAGRSTSS